MLFPNKYIEETYLSVFDLSLVKKTSSGAYHDQVTQTEFNKQHIQWLVDNDFIQRSFDPARFAYIFTCTKWGRIVIISTSKSKRVVTK